MAILELVPLRSKLPTGRMTLRHVVPAFNPVTEQDLVAEDRFLFDPEPLSTTPKVASTVPGADETPARKGGEAR